MKKNTRFLTEEKESRRSILKKMGRVSAFTIPVIASFQLSELKVHASVGGADPSQPLDLNSAWDTYWSDHNDFLGGDKSYWEQAKDTWFAWWQLLYG